MELSLNDLRNLMCPVEDAVSRAVGQEDECQDQRYVIVRCRDAGVHAGYLVSYKGREATLRESRRLWYWKPANNAIFLSGVAAEGLHSDSKVGCPVDIVLTETCEIIDCSAKARISISGAESYVK